MGLLDWLSAELGLGVFLSFVGNSALWVIIVGIGGFGRVGSNPGYARAGQDGFVIFCFFLGLVIGWLPCMLAWWRTAQSLWL